MCKYVVMRSITAYRLQWMVGGVIATAGLGLGTAAIAAARAAPPAWGQVGLVVVATFAGYHLQFSVRMRGQRLIFLWCHTAAGVALVLFPAAWMVLATAAGWALATFGPGGLRAVKAAYNTALYTTAAGVAAVVYRAVHPQPLSLGSWSGPAAVVGAMLLFSVVVDIGVQGVIAAASGTSFLATWRDGVGARCLQVAADLALALISAAAVILRPQLLIATAVAGVVLHLAYRAAAAARAERLSGERLATAVRAIGTGTLDREAAASRAVEQAAQLMDADTAELLLHGPTSLLVRYGGSGQFWMGDPADAGTPTGQIGEVCPIGSNGSLGELRIFYGSPVRVGQRDRSRLAALGAAVDVALRSAAAHAEVAAMAADAAHAANHDSLTGLPVRRVLLEHIERHLARCRCTGAADPVALICLNIRGYAEILGEFSAEAADRLLGHVARQLAAGVGTTEYLCHLGGDTFAVWLPTARDVDQVRERAVQLLALMGAPAVVEAAPVVLPGVAGFVYATPAAAGAAPQLLHQAQVALRAGHRRRQQVTVYRPEDDSWSHSAIVLASELRSAIPNHQLEMVYQPVLELATGRPVAVEAQPRWLHPSRGLLEPGEWMPVLAQSELVGDYVQWALGEALAARRAWRDLGAPPAVAVRLPRPALLDPMLPDTVAAALARAGLTPGQLVIEVGGAWVLDVADMVIDTVLAALDDHGVGLAVDIAGLSLEQLCRIPASELTLSGRTTQLLATHDQAARAKVRAIVACADELGLAVRAQDIPTLDDVKALVRLKVQTGQGPCLGQPRHATEIGDELQRAAERARRVQDAKVITLRPRDP